MVALAAALRLAGLDVQSLWHDELFVLYAVAKPTLAQAVVAGAIEDVHPPLYTMLLYGWTALFGTSEVAVRMPSALAGIATVVAIAKLGRLWFSERVGLVSAALASVAYMPIYYSQEGRPYALLLLGSIVLVERVTVFERLPAGETRLKRGAMLASIGIIGVLMCYLHYFGVLFTALVWVAWGWRVRPAHRAAWQGVGAVTAVAYLPWLLPLYNQLGHGQSWMDPPTPSSVWRVAAQMSNGARWAVLALWAMGGALSRPVERAGVPLLLCWLVVPVATAFALSWAVLPIFDARNLIVVLPAVWLLTAFAIDRIEAALRGWLRGWPVVIGMVVGLLLVDLFWVRDYYRMPTKWQYREVARAIVSATPPGVDPFVMSGAWHPSYFDHYFAQLGSDLRVDQTWSGPRQVQADLGEARPAVLFVAAPVIGKRQQRLVLTLEGYGPPEHIPFLGFDLFRFTTPDPTP